MLTDPFNIRNTNTGVTVSIRQRNSSSKLSNRLVRKVKYILTFSSYHLSLLRGKGSSNNLYWKVLTEVLCTLASKQQKKGSRLV